MSMCFKTVNVMEPTTNALYSRHLLLYNTTTIFGYRTIHIYNWAPVRSAVGFPPLFVFPQFYQVALVSPLRYCFLHKPLLILTGGKSYSYCLYLSNSLH